MALYAVDNEQQFIEYRNMLYQKHEKEIIDIDKEFGKCKSGFYSGCNYYINKGNNEWEPLRSATSMHDCDNCEQIKSCQLKKDYELWFYDQEKVGDS